MRNFYNVPCPCSEVIYGIIGEHTKKLFPLETQERTFVEMQTHRVVDFGAFIDEELSADGDYFLYKMEPADYGNGEHPNRQHETLIHFRYAFIPQSKKDEMGWGRVERINSEVNSDNLKTREEREIERADYRNRCG